MTITIPRFMLVPDQRSMHLFILSTKEPMTLFAVTHETPSQLKTVRGIDDPQVKAEALQFWRELQLPDNQN